MTMRLSANLLMLIAVTFSATSSSLAFEWDGDVDRNAVASRLRDYWNSIEDLEVTGEEYESDRPDSLELDKSKPRQRWSFILGSGGRRAAKSILFNPDGTTVGLYQFFEDGKKIITIVPFEDDPASVASIVIKKQTDTNDDYKGAMNNFLWLWTPGGRPLHSRIADGAELERTRAGDGSDVFSLYFQHRGARVRCELDPKRNWLARKVETPGGFLIWEATRFERHGGLYFPVEGTYSQCVPPSKTPQRIFIRIKEVALNRHIASTTFNPPEPTDGVLVRDEIKGRTTVVGGVEARDRLVALHGLRLPPMAETGRPNSPKQRVLLWSILLAGSLTMAVFLGRKLLRRRILVESASDPLEWLSNSPESSSMTSLHSVHHAPKPGLSKPLACWSRVSDS
jgi:hypothetical protein